MLGVDADRVRVAARVRVRLVDDDLVLAVQQVRGDEPGDARADDRDPHGRAPPLPPQCRSALASRQSIYAAGALADHRSVRRSRERRRRCVDCSSLAGVSATRRRTRPPMKRVATPPTDRQAPGRSPLGGTSEHQSLSKYIRARFEECSRSQKDVAQYIVDHLDEAAFQTAEELARRANTSSSTVVRFSQALGFEGFPELQAAAREEYRRVHAKPAEPGAASPSTPLFSLDQNEFETALAADHLNVEETARKVSRSSVERADRGDRLRREGARRGHRPDGLLRQLPAPPADAARPARRRRRQPVAGGAQPARAHRRRARS